MFYANKAVIGRGDDVTLCYGVEGAESLTLDPPIEQIKPAFNRCFGYKPQKTTDIKLTARNAGGHEASQTITVRVEGVYKPPEAASQATGSHGLIATFVAMPPTITASRNRAASCT